MALWSVSQIESGDADVFSVRWGPTGLTSVWAVVLAASGTALLTGILDAKLGPTLSAAYGVVGLVLATLLAGYRRISSIDRREGVFTEWRGLLVPFVRRSVPIHPQSVRIERQARYNSDSPGIDYPHITW